MKTRSAAEGAVVAAARAGITPLPDFLEWVARRLEYHGDDSEADFVLSLRTRAGLFREALANLDAVEHGIMCPSCKGERKTFAFVNPGGGKYIDCMTCKGTGKVAADYPERFEAGRRFGELRRHADLSLREAATLLKLRPSGVSDLEFGRASLEDILAATRRVIGVAES